MRVLVLSPRQAWPVNTGAKLREYHLARQLSGQAELTLLAFASDPEALREGQPFYHKIVAVPPPKRYTPWNVARGLLGTQPLTVLNYTTPEMGAAVERLMLEDTFDLVQIEGSPLANYVPRIQQGPGAPLVVYNWHNIESELMARYANQCAWPRSFYARHTARLLEATEGDMLRRGTAHLVCSSREKTRLEELAPSCTVQVIPNGVDVQYFTANPGVAQRHRILFVGSLDYHANIDAAVTFAHEIWPQVRLSLPHLRLTLLGANPAPSVRALASLPGVEVTGTVPDLRPYYADACASVVPLKTGGGTRLKILEAFAAGVPVVSTAIGAEGLEVVHGKHLLLAERAEDWVTALMRLQSDPNLTAALIANGRETVTQCHDWSVIGSTLCDFYQDLLSAGTRS